MLSGKLGLYWISGQALKKNENEKQMVRVGYMEKKITT